MRERPDAAIRTISRNIRLHRLARRMSQSELGAALGVSFQQVQKYEQGRNRVSSTRLLRIAQALKVDVLTLLGAGNGVQHFPVNGSSPVDLLNDPQALRLVTIFSSLKDAELRRSLLAIASRFAHLDQRSRKARSLRNCSPGFPLSRE